MFALLPNHCRYRYTYQKLSHNERNISTRVLPLSGNFFLYINMGTACQLLDFCSTKLRYSKWLRNCIIVYNGTEKLSSTLDRVSCTNYFMSIAIIRCSVRRIETTKPDKKQSVAKSHCIFFNMTQQCAVAGLPRRPMTVVSMPRMQTSRAYEFMGVNPPSFPSIPPHENAALVQL